MIKPDLVDALAGKLRGRIVLPENEQYDNVRTVWNGMVDKHPALIVQCLGTSDVMHAVDFARDHALPLAVRGGGHSVAGLSVCEAGLMLDLSLMRGVRVDPDGRTARVEPGAQLGDLDTETQAFGLAVPAGVDSRTGVAGLTLGGGQGFLSRSFGLTADSLLSADVVTADGRLITASADSHPDLFWALRGGAGRFGVVTSFEFRLHALGPEIMTAQIFHPGADAARVLRCYRDFMNDAPDEVAVYALCVPVPPADPFPEAHHGKTAIALIGCHAGGIDEGRQAFAPLTEFGDPLMSSVAPMPYRVLQDSFTDGAPNGGRYYWKSHYMNELSDAAIDVMAGYATALPGPFSNFFIEPLGGAIQRVAADATAFPHRGAAYSFGISSGWAEPDGDESGVQWTRAFHDALAPHASGGFYINYLDHDESMHVESAYGDNYARLLDVKARYDPDDLFRLAAH